MILNSNIHTHTLYSDGHDTPEEMITRAIELGFTSLGFSDHSYNKHEDGSSIDTDKYKSYHDEISFLKNKYKDIIQIFCGIEQDSFSASPSIDLDYIIGSVHSLELGGKKIPVDMGADVQENIINDFFGGYANAFAEEYFRRVHDHIKTLRPDVVGHFDLINKYSAIDETNFEYKKIATDYLRETAKFCDIFEVNTGAMARGLRQIPYPADFLLREINSLGKHIIVNSDCHYKEKLAFAFNEMPEYLKAIGFESVLILTNNGFTEVGL